MTISSITVPDTYRYDTECIPFGFVSGNSDPETFKRDLTLPSGSSVIIGDTKVPSRGLERIRARQPAVVRRARELRAILGDPLVELARILQDIPVEDDVWDRVVQEPYG